MMQPTGDCLEPVSGGPASGDGGCRRLPCPCAEWTGAPPPPPSPAERARERRRDLHHISPPPQGRRQCQMWVGHQVSAPFPPRGWSASGAMRRGRGAICSPPGKGGVPEEPSGSGGEGVPGQPRTLRVGGLRTGRLRLQDHRPGPLGGRSTSPRQGEEPDRTERHRTIAGALCSPPDAQPQQPPMTVGSPARRHNPEGRP